MDTRALVDAVFKSVHEYVAPAFAALEERIRAVESRTTVTIDDLRPTIVAEVSAGMAAMPVPKDGTDADPEQIRQVVAAAVAQIPAPKDGQDASPEMVGVAVHEALAHALAALPKPVAIDDIRTLVTECMAEALSLLPVPQKGDKGDKGDDGESVRAEDFRPLFEAESARALLSFERRASDVLQRAIDRIDAGLIERALEQIDFSLVDDGDGNVTICFVRGEASKEFALRVPRFKDCGIYRDGGAHRAGDGVTHGGSFWISQKDGPQGAPGESSDWRLAVKKGRDGKDAPQPESIPAGPVRFK